MHNWRLSTYLIILYFFALTHELSVDLTEERIKTLDEMINTQMKEARLKNVGLVIVNQTHFLHTKIYGEGNKIETNRPFILGSVSKSFTALAILKSGIPLNKTLDKYDLKEYIDDEDAKEITVSELLNHTSGLKSFSSTVEYKRGYFNYSNQGYALLGKIIEKENNNIKYHKYMEENIFGPAGMKNTYAQYDDAIVESYDSFLGFITKYKNLKAEIGNGFYVPAGFISSSIEDMGKYIQYYYLNTSEYIDKMVNTTVDNGYNQKYGMGINFQNHNGIKIYKHAGETTSFLSLLTVIPEYNIGFFIVTNTHDTFCIEPTTKLLDNVEKFLLYDYFDPIHSSLLFYYHFTYDFEFLFIIGLYLMYLIISIVRKAKKTKYTWFIGVKGGFTFGLDLFFLILIPIFFINVFYSFDSSVRILTEGSKDIRFTVWSMFSIGVLTFIIKLIYLFIYKKFYDKNKDIKLKEDIGDKNYNLFDPGE